MAKPTRYQDVISATNYALTAEDGTPFPVFLAFNGSTQFLQTNPIDFSSTDKVLVAAGVRKLSNAVSTIVEINPSFTSGNFTLLSFTTKARAGLAAGGGGTYGNIGAPYPFPVSTVASVLYDTAGATADTEIKARINGTQEAYYPERFINSTGNFGNYPLDIGARAGTSLFFNGRLYSLIIAGIKPTDAQILGVETYINSLTRAF